MYFNVILYAYMPHIEQQLVHAYGADVCVCMCECEHHLGFDTKYMHALNAII